MKKTTPNFDKSNNNVLAFHVKVLSKFYLFYYFCIKFDKTNHVPQHGGCKTLHHSKMLFLIFRIKNENQGIETMLHSCLALFISSFLFTKHPLEAKHQHKQQIFRYFVMKYKNVEYLEEKQEKIQSKFKFS